ncbi:MAG: hypothetical protein ABEJ40_00665 [Haloarculaceae archaeon]
MLGTGTATGLSGQYSRVVDVVDAGADDSGQESVTPVLERVIDDDTLLQFPPGRYYMDSQVRITDCENVGLVGDDATLVPADYYAFDGPQYRLFRLGTADDPARSIEVRNFDVDQTAAATGIRAFEVSVSDDVVIEDVTVHGEHDSGTWGPLLVRITDPGGSGVVRRFRAPDGGAVAADAPGDLWRGPTGMLVDRHHGDLRIADCVLGPYPDNGLYVSGDGRIVVHEGVYKNSNVASIRIGADRSILDGPTVVVDEVDDDYERQRPIRLDYGSWHTIQWADVRMPTPNGSAITLRSEVQGATLRGTDISIGDGPASGVVIRPGTGPVYLDNVDVDIETSGNAIRILGQGGPVGVQGGRIRGGAPGTQLRDAIRCERDDCAFRHVDVDQWGGTKRRALVVEGDGTYVYDCLFRSTDRPITVNGDDTWIEDCYLNAYSGTESVVLNDTASMVRLKDNELPDGVVNRGATDVTETGTTY